MTNTKRQATGRPSSGAAAVAVAAAVVSAAALLLAGYGSYTTVPAGDGTDPTAEETLGRTEWPLDVSPAPLEAADVSAEILVEGPVDEGLVWKDGIEYGDLLYWWEALDSDEVLVRISVRVTNSNDEAVDISDSAQSMLVTYGPTGLTRWAHPMDSDEQPTRVPANGEVVVYGDVELPVEYLDSLEVDTSVPLYGDAPYPTLVVEVDASPAVGQGS